MIHLYAFVRGLREELEPPLERLPLGPFEAIAGHDEPEPLEHGLVVESLLDRADSVLPVRFGERFEDETALAAAVAPRREALEAALARVAGCVEVSVRVNGRPPRAEAASGAAYLRERGREQRRVDQVHGALANLARASVRTSGEAGYLLSRDDVDAFACEVERLLDGQPGLDGICTGPWAPYSFAEAP